MGKILHLPKNLRLKIAAGEVIESPASVVKELIENSIDAGATSIVVEVEEGGLKRILVRDNGEGIAKEDLPLAVERFSTSKLKSEEDLTRIHTLGFRGEALASICAISKMKIISRVEGDEGYSISCTEGKITPPVNAPHPKGTTVEVRELFFNLPARKKFLPSVSSLFREISRVFQHAALSRPEVHFTLIKDGRELANYPPTPSLKERIASVMGREFLDTLMEIKAQAGGFVLSGYASKKGRGRMRPTQIFFLNSRPIKNRELSIALNNAYSGLLEKPRLPDGVIFLEAPVETYDVNVHPSKREVKFKDKGAIFHVFSLAVKGWRGETSPIFSTISESPSSYDSKKEMAGPVETPSITFAKGGEESSEERVRVVGQVKNLFIIAEDKDALYLIDQHNGQERVIYERLVKERGGTNALLIPVVLDLREEDLALLSEKETELRKAGFDFEVLSGGSIVIKGIPSVLPPGEAESSFIEAIRGKEKVLATIACKASVKRGEPLPMELMKTIANQLLQLENPELCPHGRPTLIKLSWADLARLIGRKEI